MKNLLPSSSDPPLETSLNFLRVTGMFLKIKFFFIDHICIKKANIDAMWSVAASTCSTAPPPGPSEPIGSIGRPPPGTGPPPCRRQPTISLDPDRIFQRERWPTSPGRRVPTLWQDRHTSQRFSWPPGWARSPQRDRLTSVFVWVMGKRDRGSLVTDWLSTLEPGRQTFWWP